MMGSRLVMSDGKEMFIRTARRKGGGGWSNVVGLVLHRNMERDSVVVVHVHQQGKSKSGFFFVLFWIKRT